MYPPRQTLDAPTDWSRCHDIGCFQLWTVPTAGGENSLCHPGLKLGPAQNINFMITGPDRQASASMAPIPATEGQHADGVSAWKMLMTPHRQGCWVVSRCQESCRKRRYCRNPLFRKLGSLVSDNMAAADTAAQNRVVLTDQFRPGDLVFSAVDRPKGWGDAFSSLRVSKGPSTLSRESQPLEVRSCTAASHSLFDECFRDWRAVRVGGRFCSIPTVWTLGS